MVVISAGQLCVCIYVCVWRYRQARSQSLVLSLNTVMRQEQEGVTFRMCWQEMNTVCGQTGRTVHTFRGAFTSQAPTPHRLYKSCTSPREPFTWLQRHQNLGGGCGWRAPAARSRTGRSSSCTSPGSSSEDAASATTAPWGSCGCRRT